MRTSKIIHLIVLLCFLPTVAGCRKTTTVRFSTDPDASASRFSEGEERILITGYEEKGADHRDWEGHVSFVPPDSLHFEPVDSGPPPKPATFGKSPAPPDPNAFTLPVDAVASIDVVDADYSTAVMFGILGVFVFFFVGAMALAYTHAINPD